MPNSLWPLISDIWENMNKQTPIHPRENTDYRKKKEMTPPSWSFWTSKVCWCTLQKCDCLKDTSFLDRKTQHCWWLSSATSLVPPAQIQGALLKNHLFQATIYHFYNLGWRARTCESWIFLSFGGKKKKIRIFFPYFSLVLWVLRDSLVPPRGNTQLRGNRYTVPKHWKFEERLISLWRFYPFQSLCFSVDFSVKDILTSLEFTTCSVYWTLQISVSKKVSHWNYIYVNSKPRTGWSWPSTLAGALHVIEDYYLTNGLSYSFTYWLQLLQLNLWIGKCLI